MTKRIYITYDGIDKSEKEIEEAVDILAHSLGFPNPLRYMSQIRDQDLVMEVSHTNSSGLYSSLIYFYGAEGHDGKSFASYHIIKKELNENGYPTP